MSMEEIKKVKLLKSHGTAGAGEVFVRGDILNGVPEYYKNKKGINKPDNWFWKEGSTKKENQFLPASCFTEKLKDRFIAI